MYSNILLKLYLRSLKDNGKLMFNDRIPYNPQMIATITRHQVGTVEKALSIFKEMGLIEVLDNGAIYMLDIQNFIGKTTTEADRKRAYRYEIENQEELIGQMADKNPPKINIDKKLDLELDKDKDKKDEKEETFKSILDEYTKNKELLESLNGFVEMRKKIKGFTTRALKLSLNKLDSLSNNDQEKIKIVDKSVMNGWKTFYELKDEEKPKESKLIQRNFEEEFGEIVDDIDF